MNDEKASQTVDQLLEGVELFDDTLYAIVRDREGRRSETLFAYGKDELRYELRIAATWEEGRLLVMPVSRTVLVELQLGGGE